MKRILLFTTFVLALFFSVNAQHTRRLANGNEQVIFAGYLIKIIPLNGNGFGYKIFLKNQTVVHQLVNPFTLTPDGLRNKEDIIKIAKWQIMDMQGKQVNRVIKNQIIAMDVAKRLDIKFNSINN